MKLQKSVTIGSATLSLETGHLAKQAQGSVLVRLGDTVVLTTACTQQSAIPRDFEIGPRSRAHADARRARARRALDHLLARFAHRTTRQFKSAQSRSPAAAYCRTTPCVAREAPRPAPVSCARRAARSEPARICSQIV